MKFSILIGSLILSNMLFAQAKMSANEYIAKYKDEAIREMLESGVPASITLAQGVLESGVGNSELAICANNHFGIKCHNDWSGDVYILDDDAKNECFRRYLDVFDSYRDHSLFLRSRSRYDSLFKLPITDYKGWAYGLKKAGYATNPKYAEMIIGIIEKNSIYKFDSLFFQCAPDTIKILSTKFFELLELKKAEKKGVYERKIYKNQDVPFIVLGNKDNFDKIGVDLNIKRIKLLKINDIQGDSLLKSGQIVYLKRKHKKSLVSEHIVKKNETLWEISQKYAVRLKSLKKLNKIGATEILTSGSIIRLN